MKYVLSVIIFIPVIIASCSSKKGDYKTPFYKVFSGNIKGRAYTLHLYRDTSTGAVSYGGTLIDTVEQLPVAVSGTASDSANPSHILFSAQENEDSAFQLNGTISGDARLLEGKWFLSAAGKNIDSAAFSFNADATQTLFDYYSAEETYTAAKSGYTGHTAIAFMWPRGWENSSAEKNVKHQIATMLDIKNDTAANPLPAYLAAARIDFNATYNDMDSTETDAGSSDADKQVLLHFQNAKWIVLVHSNSHYESGMLHDQWSSGYHTFLRKSGRELKLADFLSGVGLRKLPKLVEKYFRLQYKLKPGEPLTRAGLFQNRIGPNKNFYVTGRQLVFHYSNYEIAPFAFGEFDVMIPLTEFEGQMIM